MDCILVNMTMTVNAGKIRHEKREGRDVIVVPSATLPDNIVMNRIMYPAEAIEVSYKQLERSPAPFGHPKRGNLHVSAYEPDAINGYWVGAYNESVRRENGRVLMDKVIDVERAQSSANGQRLLDAINKQQPIHSSTGIFMTRKKAPEGTADYDWIASNMVMDHDAILLDEEGAATPDQGVGLFVNSDGQGQEVMVVNSELSPAQMDAIDYIGMAIDGIEREQKREDNRGRARVILDTISNMLKGSKGQASGLQANSNDGDQDMAEVTKEQFEALTAKVDKLVTNSSNAPDLAQIIQDAMKPLNDKVDALTANVQAEQEKERGLLVNKVVKAGILGEETAKSLELNALREISKSIKDDTKGTAGAVGGMTTNSGKSEWEGYDLNANIDAGEKK